MNFKTSNYMDQIYVGELMDENVCTTDITSLFNYQVNKNFVSITFIDEDDSRLTKLCRKLPD